MYKGTFQALRKPDQTIEVTLNNKYCIKEGDEFYETVETLVDLINEKNSKTPFKRGIGINFFSSLEFLLGKHKMEEQSCMICLEEFQVKDIEKELFQHNDADTYALKCSHIYHEACLKSMIGGKNWIKCPICMTIYGQMTGDMPDGKMQVTVDPKLRCQGYKDGTIVINYYFPGCNRNGISIPGTSRTCFLPNNPEGNQVLQLLQECWKRKLTFTIGRSVTTGRDNQIVWNGIHHKTCTSGGAANFGYPDETYLKRVKEELAAKGITEETMKMK